MVSIFYNIKNKHSRPKKRHKTVNIYVTTERHGKTVPPSENSTIPASLEENEKLYSSANRKQKSQKSMSARKKITSADQDSSKSARGRQKTWGPKTYSHRELDSGVLYGKVVIFIDSNCKIISDMRVYENNVGIPFDILFHYINDDKSKIQTNKLNTGLKYALGRDTFLFNDKAN